VLKPVQASLHVTFKPAELKRVNHSFRNFYNSIRGSFRPSQDRKQPENQRKPFPTAECIQGKLLCSSCYWGRGKSE